MTVSRCPLCQSPLQIFVRGAVECSGWHCTFKILVDEGFIMAAVLAHHMRPLAEPHAFKANPDYPGQCDEPVGDPVVPCNRPKECHR